MRNVFLDTETTNLTPGQIAQLSYIVEDNGKVQGKNFFFKVDSMDEGAEKVTGHGSTITEWHLVEGYLRIVLMK